MRRKRPLESTATSTAPEAGRAVRRQVHGAGASATPSPCACAQPSTFEALAASTTLACLRLIDRAGLLKPLLRYPVQAGLRAGAIGEPPSRAVAEESLSRFTHMIREEASGAPGRKNWEQLTRELEARVGVGPGATRLGDPRFRAELEGVMGSPFRPGNKVKLLVDGPAAFDKRYRLLPKVKHRLYLSTWRFDIDATGRRMCRELAALARRGVDVRVLVDGQVADRQDNGVTLGVLEAAGVKVQRWRDADHPLSGLHAKILVVDDQVIGGGMNYADCYSHGHGVEGDDPVEWAGYWRDTDVLVQGPATLDAIRAFQGMWNKVAKSPADRFDARAPVFVSPDNPRRRAPAEPPGIKARNADVAVVFHEPTSGALDPIAMAMMKLIWGAERQIEVENAYYVRIPAIQGALVAACERGLKVRIHTNSAESVDEGLVRAPMLESLHELAEAGAEIFLRKEKSLHSKFMTIDDEYAVVGSYNLNPRSVRYDNELVYVIRQPGFAEGTRHVFEADIAHAREVKSLDDLDSHPTLISRLAGRYFFEHL